MPFLLINKPKGWTSFDVVAYLRGSLKVKKIGHAGTLDPFATGLLIVGVERAATKKLEEFKNLSKTYQTKIRLGAYSDTQDSTGKITIHDTHNMIPMIDNVKKVLQTFIGKQKQLPPMYSAKKIKGKKLYKLARQGVEIEREPNEIEIYGIKLLNYEYPQLEIEVNCGAGTYIRALAHDIGKALGTGAYCDELIRTKIGEYNISKALEVKNINKENYLQLAIVNKRADKQPALLNV